MEDRLTISGTQMPKLTGIRLRNPTILRFYLSSFSGYPYASGWMTKALAFLIVKLPHNRTNQYRAITLTLNEIIFIAYFKNSSLKISIFFKVPKIFMNFILCLSLCFRQTRCLIITKIEMIVL